MDAAEAPDFYAEGKVECPECGSTVTLISSSIPQSSVAMTCPCGHRLESTEGKP